MGSMKVDDIAPGWIDVWRLWRNCLCRFGWYPLLVAPLVTCACLLDIYSSTGCDFIRLNIGFIPANDVWESSNAQLGLFSFDSHEDDHNKWKRSFNNGCQSYTPTFESIFIDSDQTWYMSRILAYISGIASLVAVATAWLLTITPIPASFFWPGVLLPAVILAMLTGASKFVFFDTQICNEELWFAEGSSSPVAAQSCDIGESSVFCIASVAAYFFCTILICFRSPQKRVLDENWGKDVRVQAGSTVTQHTGRDIECNNPIEDEEMAQQNLQQQAVSDDNNVLGIEERELQTNTNPQQKTAKKNGINNNTTPQVNEHSQHTRATSDMTWSTGPPNEQPPYTATDRCFRNNLGVLSPILPKEEKLSEISEDSEDSSDLDWTTHGHPIIVTINDSGQGVSRDNRGELLPLSYSDGSTTQTLSSKSPVLTRGSNANKLPPRPHRKSAINQPHKSSNSRSDYDAGSVHSKISKISFANTQTSDVSVLGMSSYTGAPSVVAIPRRNRHTLSGISPGSTSSSSKRLRYAKNKSNGSREAWEDNNEPHSITPGSVSSNRFDAAKREMVDYLPRLDEMSSSRSLEDHGDLINQCVRDLEKSFVDDNGFRTL